MKTIDYNYCALIGPAVLVIGTIVSMLYWTQLGRAGRRVVKWVHVTILKHGAWLSATALLSLACGMAA